ncbi:MAG: carbon-nitrogen family hydrolase [Clostridia bacterium]|nr:carbon-nitrogen family hydrolase [Clostridia bacterium]
MKISVIQMDVKLNAPDINFNKAKKLIKEAVSEDPDVIVLPETFNVGFFPKDIKREFCDIDGKRVKEEIGKLAKEYNVNIVAGSVANIKNGNLYNTAYVFSRSGEQIAEYDKINLFSAMDEDKYFNKGDKTVRFYLDGHPCTLIICYDIRFPEIIRKATANEPTDLLFILSEWPKVRINELTALVTERATENRMFAVCSNSCGKANDVKYGGNSVIVDPLGNILIKAEETESIITANCDIQ